MKLSFLAAITLFGAAIATPVAGGKEQKPVRLHLRPINKKRIIADNDNRPSRRASPASRTAAWVTARPTTARYLLPCPFPPIPPPR